ncbi:hypothetical protein Tco_0021561, partial [Tanacetum coccineum]
VLSYEEEMNFSVFKCSKEDSIGKPLYSRFTTTNDFKGVPHPLSGDYTPKPQEEIDDSFEGSCGNTFEHSFETESESLNEPNEMSKSRLEVTNKKDVSAPKSKEVEPSCVLHIKTPRQPLKDKETHKKMEKEAEVKRVVNTGNGVAKPVWTNANRVNHANQFVLRSVQLNAGRPKLNSVRPNINTGRTNINFVRPNINTGRTNTNFVGPKVNAVNPKGSAIKTSASYNWRNSRPNFNYNRSSTEEHGR